MEVLAARISRLLWLFAFFVSTSAIAACPSSDGVALQVLGSGGPIADDDRASSGYIVWIDGASRILIDAGGGTFLRFGEAAARFNDLEFIGLSHFHTDHSADLPALLKSGSFTSRERPLTIAGPDGGGSFPGLVAWLERLLDADDGAYAYLGGYLDGRGRLKAVTATEVAGDGIVRVFESAETELVVDALHVPHGIVPALGYRIRAGGRTVVFASDQNGSDPAFAAFAQDADLLVMHLAIPEGATGPASRLHATPSVIADVAAKAGAAKLLLSHLMARSLRELESNVGIVRKGFGGPVQVASDLLCIPLD